MSLDALENANEYYFIKHAIMDTTVNPREGNAQYPTKEYSEFLFYPKNQSVSLGTLLPAAGRGLETCQFLRWPNTEGLVSPLSFSLSLSLSCSPLLTMYERLSSKTTRKEEREFACECVLERKKEVDNLKKDTESRGRWMQHIDILSILHSSVPQ